MAAGVPEQGGAWLGMDSWQALEVFSDVRPPIGASPVGVNP